MIQLGDEVIWPEVGENGYHGHFTVLDIFPSRFLKDDAGLALPTALIEPFDTDLFCKRILELDYAENESVTIEVPLNMLYLVSNRTLH